MNGGVMADVRHPSAQLVISLSAMVWVALVLFVGVMPIAAQAQTPFRGSAFAIPATFEAEDFDLGGEGVAYHDKVPGNAGGQYRTSEEVDIIGSLEPAGGDL